MKPLCLKQFYQSKCLPAVDLKIARMQLQLKKHSCLFTTLSWFLCYSSSCLLEGVVKRNVMLC